MPTGERKKGMRPGKNQLPSDHGRQGTQEPDIEHVENGQTD